MKRPSLTWWAFGCAAALAACTLQLELLFDDLGLILRVRGLLPELGGPYDLYRFTGPTRELSQRLISTGPWPWWTDPDTRAAFFRPLSSALFAFDVRVFGDQVIWWHLHSIAWYFALLALVRVLYRQILPESVWGLSLLLFAIDDTHWLPVAWAANRNSVVACVAAVAGLIFHLRWRERGWRSGAALSALMYAAALSAGEAALGVLAFVGTYELTHGSGRSFRQRIAGAVPLLSVVAVWAVAYKALGYGAKGSAIYIDPATEPVRYLSAFPGRVCALLGSLTLGVVSDVWMFMSRGRAVLVAAGVLGALFFLWAIRRALPQWSEDQRRRIRWLVAGTLLALLPVASTFPSDRLLLPASVGAAAVAATLLRTLVALPGWPVKVAVGALVLTQVIAPLPAWVVSPRVMRLAADRVNQGVLHTPLGDDALAGHVVLFSAPDPFVAMSGGFARMVAGRPAPKAWHFISYAPYDHRLTRVSDSRLEVSVVDGELLGTVMEQLFRAPEKALMPGMRVDLQDLQVTVLEERAGRPTRLQVDLLKPTTEYTFVQWRNEQLVSLPLPEVGQQLLLPHPLGPLDQVRRLLGG